MSERKAINKYYPPDWDPSKVTKKIKPKNQSIKVRLEAPYSMRCLKCSEYISALRKFNARKEITKETYMNVKIIRFYISCPRCNNQITFKTNPQNADFVPENGAVRNYESKKKVAQAPKDRQETEEEILLRLEKEDKDNSSYQLLKEKRKKDPFWQKKTSLKDKEGNIIDNLSEKLAEQQRQQQLSEELEDIHKKNQLFNKQGGTAAAIAIAQEKLSKQDATVDEAEIEGKESLEAKLAFQRFKSTPASAQVRDNLSTFAKTPLPYSISSHAGNGSGEHKNTLVLRKKANVKPPRNHNGIKKVDTSANTVKTENNLVGILGDYSSDDD